MIDQQQAIAEPPKQTTQLTLGETVEVISGDWIEVGLIEWIGEIPQEPEMPLAAADLTVSGRRFGICRMGSGRVGARWLVWDKPFSSQQAT